MVTLGEQASFHPAAVKARVHRGQGTGRLCVMAARWQTVKVKTVRPKDKILGLRWPQLRLFMGKGVPSHEWQYKTIWKEEKGRWGGHGLKQLHPSPTIRWSHYLFLLSCFVWVVGEPPSPGTFVRKHPRYSLTPGDFVSMSEGHKSREKASCSRY